MMTIFTGYYNRSRTYVVTWYFKLPTELEGPEAVNVSEQLQKRNRTHTL